MFIIKLIYKKQISDVEKSLTAHRDYLDCYYQKGLFLASGPMMPRTGGIIIAATNDRTYLESVITKDPFFQEGIADYELIQFVPVKYCKELSQYIVEGL